MLVVWVTVTVSESKRDCWDAEDKCQDDPACKRLKSSMSVFCMNTGKTCERDCGKARQAMNTNDNGRQYLECDCEQSNLQLKSKTYETMCKNRLSRMPSCSTQFYKIKN